MGHLRHETMVISDWDAKNVYKAHEAASAIFNAAGMGSIVGGVVRHAINGGAAFFIAPDGSKEGWGHSDDGSRARLDLISYLKTIGVDWALILLGGDDGEFGIIECSGEQSSPLPSPS